MDCIYYKMHYINLNMYTAERMKQIREKRNITQSETASMLGMTRQAYGKLENNITNIHIEHLEHLCNIFHVCLSDFLPLHLLYRQDTSPPVSFDIQDTLPMSKPIETEKLLKLISGFAALVPADQNAILEFINRKLL